MTNNWREERLYVLETIKELKSEQIRHSEEAAAARAKAEEKYDRETLQAKKDMREAHDKIRSMEKEVRTLERAKMVLLLKNWVQRLALGAVGAGAVELIKALVKEMRPR